VGKGRCKEKVMRGERGEGRKRKKFCERGF